MAEKGFLELAAKAPWPVGFTIGSVGFVGCAYVLPAILASLDNHFLKAIGTGPKEAGLFWVGSAFLAVFWSSALISFLSRRGKVGAQQKRVDDKSAPRPRTENGAPTCPKCGNAMVRRTARGSNDQFWGCSTFPKCRATLPVKS